MIKFEIFQQHRPKKVGEEFVARIICVGTLFAAGHAAAIAEAKTWTIFKVGKGLARFPVVQAEQTEKRQHDKDELVYYAWLRQMNILATSFTGAYYDR